MFQAQLERAKDLVLVGGGHSHVVAIKMFSMQPIDGQQITLISSSIDTPYSAMIPGLIAGHYEYCDAHIDLMRLCRWAGIRFVQAEVIGLDPQRKRLDLLNRPPIFYDVVSFDVGAGPNLNSVNSTLDNVIPVKPISKFWDKWLEVKNRSWKDNKIAVVGGGAGSAELALSMAESLFPKKIKLDLYCGSSRLLPEFSIQSSHHMKRALKNYGVTVHVNAWVDKVTKNHLVLKSNVHHSYDVAFWCTNAAPTSWLANSGLPLDNNGFLATTSTLQSLDDNDIFAVGDCAALINQPRPKAGVFAVRQGPILAHNLRARLLKLPLRQYRPQKKFLSILSLGKKSALTTFGPFFLKGFWVWQWKHAIDIKFMNNFSILTEKKEGLLKKFQKQGNNIKKFQPYCGGCGAKIAPDVLSDVLKELSLTYPKHCKSSGDDANELNVPQELVWQSLDVLREVVSDPWRMGQLAAHHALSDLYACGLQPVSAQALIVLPFASPEIQFRELKQVLDGSLSVFQAAGCCLIGGHSMQGPETQIGFAVNGVLPHANAQLLRKRALGDSDILVVSRKLGSGILFAAHMQNLAEGIELDKALVSMSKSNSGVALAARIAGVNSVTDVTGFGLAVHLKEMLSPYQRATIDVAALPIYEGVLSYLEKGIRSTMHESNKRACQSFLTWPDHVSVKAELIFDPQTCGGLLMGIDPSSIKSFKQAMSDANVEVHIIGRVERSDRQSLELC